MGIVITVDLGASSPGDIARAAKFMLEFIGYQAPSVGRDAAVGTGSLGEEVSGDTQALPQGVFGNFPQVATPEGDEATIATEDPEPVAPLPPIPEQAVALPPPPPGIEVDAQGVPWDSRIHAGSRARIADGTWRQRRNLDPEVFKAVMADLRQTMGVERRAPTPPAPPVPAAVFAPAPPVPPVPVVEPVAATPEVPPVPFAGSAVPPAPPASGTPPVPGSAGAATGASLGDLMRGAQPVLSFPELMKRITPAFAAKTLTQADITRACGKVGLTSLPMLASRPDLVADVATELGIAL